MKYFSKTRLLSFLIGLCSIISMWLVWVICQNLINNEYVLPSFSSVIKSLFSLVLEGFFYRALYKTMLKVFIAFILSLFLACVFSTLCYVFKGFGVFFKPFLAVVRTLPTMAILVIILLYANAFFSPIWVAVLVLFPMMFSSLTIGFNSIDDGLIGAMKVFNLSKKDRIFKVYIPNILPHIAFNMGANLSFSVKLVISAEVMAYTFTSIGGMMQSANGTMDIARLMALTLVAVLLGLIIEFVCYLIFKNSFKWQREGGDD